MANTLPAYAVSPGQSLTASQASVSGASYDMAAQAGSGTTVQQYRVVATFTNVKRGDELSLYTKSGASVLFETRRSAGTILDTAPTTGRNLKVTGSPTLSNGRLILSGVDSGVGASDGAYIAEGAGGTSLHAGGSIFIRFKRSRTSVTEALCGEWSDGATNAELSHLFYLDNTGKVNFAYNKSAFGLVAALTGTSTIGTADNQWAMVQINPSTMKASLYVNGTREAQHTAVAFPIDPAGVLFQIGYNSGNGVIANLFSGQIDELYLTTAALQADDGAAYTPPAGALPDDANTLAHYTFEEMLVADDGDGTDTLTLTGRWDDIPAGATTLTWSAANNTAARGTLATLRVEGRAVPVTGGTTRFTPNNSAPLISNAGGGSTFKSSDVANPQRAFDAARNRWFANYSGFDAALKWSMALAFGDSGGTLAGPFTDAAQNPLMSPGDFGESYITANGSVLADGDVFTHWYQITSAAAIHRATSTLTAGVFSTFISAGAVISGSEQGEASAFDPCIRPRTGGGYECWYMGGDASATRYVRYAVSTDGITWTERRILFGVLPYRAFFLGEPSAFRERDGTLHIFFDSASTIDSDRQICEAVTRDNGATWTFTPDRVPKGGTGKAGMTFDADARYNTATEQIDLVFAASDSETPNEGGNFNIYRYVVGFAPAFAAVRTDTTAAPALLLGVRASRLRLGNALLPRRGPGANRPALRHR